MRLDWDDNKSDKLQKERGLSLGEAAAAIEGRHFSTLKNDDPEQFVGIGFAKGQLITLVYEFREDTDGEYIWLITYWKSSKVEVKIYEKYAR